MSFSNKTEFLNNAEIAKFVDYLSNLITGKEEFKHTYKIEHKAWRKQHGEVWSCNNLIDAKNKYWWHGSYEENKKQLSSLSEGLKQSVTSGVECDVLYWSMRVLEWGDVYKGCTGFILDNYEKNSLTKSISDASRILEGTDYNVTRFNDDDLRMDSGLTKVYSLNSEQSIIFDSRVTAALVLIAWRLFTEEERKTIDKLRVFAGGKATGNPKNRVKRSHIQGKKVFNQQLEPKNQAKLNLLANWMLDEAINISEKKQYSNIYEMWGVNEKGELLRAIEASLFMIGSDISNG